MTEAMEARFLTARRNYIARQFSNLNEMQKSAVLTTEGPLLLLAGAGSGKTTVLINRIQNLLRYGRGSDCKEVPAFLTEEDVSYLEGLDGKEERADALCAVDPPAPWNVIAITFTNKAANELKERLAASMGEAARDVWAMTFHSACCRILRRDIDRLGFDRRFTIYDTADSERIMKEIIKEMGLDDKTFPAKMVLSKISRAKDRQLTPEKYAAVAASNGDFRLEKISKAYTEYQKRLKANNALDFDDIISLTVRLLQQFEEVRIFYQQKFRYVLVDEYQDTSHLQYLLVSLLAGGHENICVVGDDDQSIYRFRGATIENILSFEKQYKGARSIRLEQNYRSTQSILNAANGVISHNTGRKGKELWTANGQGDPITVFEAYNEGEEANFVAGQIIALSHGQNFKDYAILYRTNAQSNALEYAFKRNGVPYRIIGGTRFFDRAEVKDMLAYLWVLNNRNDDLRLKRIINNPPRGIGAKTVEMAERLAQAEGKSLYSIISDPYTYPALERAADKLMAFVMLIEGCAELLETLALPDFYDELILRTGYSDMLTMKPTEENKTRLENVHELKSSIMSYLGNTESPSLNGFLEEIALYTDIEQYDAEADAAVMMTIHSAKGLEFPHVFLVGVEDGLFPGVRAIGEPEEMEEERRLCYVAITRAKKTLTISHARQRTLYGRTGGCIPSRFLKEIPAECVNERGGIRTQQPRTEQSSRARTNVLAERRKEEYKRSAYSAVTARAGAAMEEFQKGDMVRHTAFGKGMVISVMKMGGDALLEIAFDEIGTKKLMAKTASAHMKRL